MRNTTYLFAVLGLLLSACGMKDDNLQSGVASQGTIGIRSFSNLYASYGAMTGVPLTNTVVKSYFTSAKGRLSLDGNPETVSPAMLLATTGLASVFCQEFITREAALANGTRLAHNGVDFTKTQALLTPALRVSVVKAYGELFWRRAPTEEESAVLVEAMAEAEVGRPLAATEVRILLRIACTAAASSFEAIQH